MRIALAIAALALCGCESSEVSRTLGAECAADGDCDGLCLTTEPAGFCTTRCDGPAACSGRALCVAAPGSTDTTHGVCEFACSSDNECAFLEGGYTCRAI